MDWPFVVVALLNVGFVLGLLMSAGGLLTWVERKQAAIMAGRVGADRAYLPIPVRVRGGGWRWSRRFTAIGLFHVIADGAKMLLKEEYTPPFADRFVYNLAPWFAVVSVLVTFAVIPFGGPFLPGEALREVLSALGAAGLADRCLGFFGERAFQLQVADVGIGLLFVFASGGTGIFAVALAGWASNSKYSLMGALRASSQMISYEVFMGMAILGLLAIYGTVDLDRIAQVQGEVWLGFVPAWGIFLQPHMLIVFLVALMAENKRVPFDMPEAESELVAGYLTEYTAMKMGLFMLSEYIAIAVISALITTLFLGAYHVPGLHAASDALYWAARPEVVPSDLLWGMPVPHALVVGLRLGAFLAKTGLLCWLLVVIRWTFPKFRYDQVMHLGWKILLPFSLVNLVATALVVTLVSA